VRVFTYAERPDLADRMGEIEDTFAAFLGHGEIPAGTGTSFARNCPSFS